MAAYAGALLVIVVLWVIACIKVLPEYERGVIFRLGRLLPEPKGPGFYVCITMKRLQTA